ncbi:MAG: hypothetical protein RAP70_00885 [Candidatus Celaenobacter antarcticus]|nr:hypothetical protein [Candidatus Celaenobacter antarcticus]
MANKNRFDFEDRTAKFGEDIIEFAKIYKPHVFTTLRRCRRKARKTPQLNKMKFNGAGEKKWKSYTLQGA